MESMSTGKSPAWKPGIVKGEGSAQKPSSKQNISGTLSLRGNLLKVTLKPPNTRPSDVARADKVASSAIPQDWKKVEKPIGERAFSPSKYIGSHLQEPIVRAQQAALPALSGMKPKEVTAPKVSGESSLARMTDHQKNCLRSSIAAGNYEVLAKYLKGDDLSKVDEPKPPLPTEAEFREKMETFAHFPLTEGQTKDNVPLEMYYGKIDAARAQIARKDFNGTTDKFVNALVGPVLFNVTNLDLVKEAALRTPEKSKGEHLERWKQERVDVVAKGGVLTGTARKTQIPGDLKEQPVKVEEASVSIAHTQGVRREMEDADATGTVVVSGQKVPFFGLFDGHGGAGTANFLSKNISTALQDELNLLGKPLDQATDAEIENALSIVAVKAEEMRRTQAAKLREEGKPRDDSGSTLTLAVVINNSVWAVNTGDSRILALQGNKTHQLTEDASPTAARFKKGVESRGGEVKGERVGGMFGIAVARAIGDQGLPGLTPRSKVTRIPLSSDVPTTLIIGCDGLFETTSSQQIADVYRKNPSAKALVAEAFQSGSGDNISAMVVTLPKATPRASVAPPPSQSAPSRRRI